MATRRTFEPRRQFAALADALSGFRLRLWGGLLVGWFLVLCFVPDPRPLGAPEWSVGAVQRLTSASEPMARAVATGVLRASGLGLLGVLLSLTLGRLAKWGVAFALGLSPVLAVVSQWINYGHFPVFFQLQLGVGSAVLGALAGLALQRNLAAAVSLVALGAGLFTWGAATGIPDDLYQAARATGLHLLDQADRIPDGEEGFIALLQAAFAYAEDNSHHADPVFPNEAAILALGVIAGEDRVAEVARRPLDLDQARAVAGLRGRITLRDRNDLARHFWVSAALVILADENRSMTVGIAKEMMDATPGGSGFSFADLAANRAGVLFALAATNGRDAARAMQERVRSGIRVVDVCPSVEGLPEGLTRDEFQSRFGGLGGSGTQEVVEEIRRRLADCAALGQTP
ncbi:MAG: hypothetical protein H7A45_12170 [Verrucomicrobiales bacterium]|nr:hypothetical protein [Verrucomicrobiales bacterium]MCP5525883.1 hypothetical protein [Verrucomicrobiales bacterium]